MQLKRKKLFKKIFAFDLTTVCRQKYLQKQLHKKCENEFTINTILISRHKITQDGLAYR